MENFTAEELIKQLKLKFKLQPLSVEGGWYRVTWSDSAGTAIYYLITPDSWSALHMLETVEIWHFYAGDPVKQLLIYSNGRAERLTLGNHLSSGQMPQSICPAKAWQSTRLIDDGKWALCGTTMAPPYSESEYHHGNTDELFRQFPNAVDLIKEFV